MDTTFSVRDRTTLSELAQRVAEVAHDPAFKARADMWRKHNGLKRVRPMVLIFPEGAWREMLPASEMSCSTEFARNIERDLRIRLYYAEHLPDDNVIEDVIASPIITRSSGWGLEGQSTRPAEQTGAYHIEPVIRSEADVEKLKAPEVIVDAKETEHLFGVMSDLFGGLLRIEKRGWGNYGLAPLDHYAGLRGIDNLFLDLVDRPEMVHKAIGRIVDGHIALVKSAERQGLFSLSNRNHYTGSGGTGYTDELPAPGFDGVHVRAGDMWGLGTAQIFSEVSPEMHEEFALQHEKRVLELFGLNCYGCCEPLHRKLDIVFRHVPRLRRVSISPWADVPTCAAKIGRKCVFSWKPNPAIVAGETWEPARVRSILMEFCEQTRGCVVEMILKDTHTCRNHPERMWEWVRIARDVAERF